MTDPTYFRDPSELRAWLRENHETESELWVGLYKKSTGRPSITWPQLVDQLMCFGWIDGLRKSVDEESYAIRVTPRRPDSNWSVKNIERMKELQEAGVVEPPGEAAFALRDEEASYSFEQTEVAFGEALEEEFRAHETAWAWFVDQAPSYRRTATWWVVSAKREETRWRRLATLVEDSEAGRRIGPLRRKGDGG